MTTVPFLEGALAAQPDLPGAGLPWLVALRQAGVARCGTRIADAETRRLEVYAAASA